ncbi:hypothetical protein BC830DRAFT_1152116 [Chytriomyces sp. MP71]|nr:hypothetical protein BC830DRAFT_1152116 [Chytriomyces sp. MP71]
MPDKKALCIKIVTSVLADASKYQFGKTKVFLKSGQVIKSIRLRTYAPRSEEHQEVHSA